MARIGLGDLFAIFARAGLAFGGGLGILAVLEDEFVTKRRALSREEFLATYALGRVVPSGTMTALAAAFGYRFGGIAGTVVALGALVLPAFVLTVALSAAYVSLADSAVLRVLPVTILPAALAFIVAAALRLGKGAFRPGFEALLAAAAFVAAFGLGLDPALVLMAGGGVGALLLTFVERPGATR
jgi:chromate transporter